MSGTHGEDPPPWQTTQAPAEGPPEWHGAPAQGDAPPQAEAPPGSWQPPPGWQPGGQPQYGHRMTWQPAPPTPGAATASLLVGITAVILLPPVGPVAVWLGSRAKRRIDASEGALGGRAVANWGVWMGWIGVLLTLVMAAMIAIYFADN